MTLKFTKYKNWKKENNIVNWEGGCNYCKGKFKDDEKFIRIDVEGLSRGDDDVHCFHKDCFGPGLNNLLNKK